MNNDIEFKIIEEGKEIDAKTAYMVLQKRLVEKCKKQLPNSSVGYIFATSVLYEHFYLFGIWVVVSFILAFPIGILMLSMPDGPYSSVIAILFAMLVGGALVRVFGALLTKRHVDKQKAALKEFEVPDDEECRNTLNKILIKLDSPLLRTAVTGTKERKERLDNIVFLMEKNIVAYEIDKDAERIDILYEDPESHNVFKKEIFVDLRQNTQIVTPQLSYVDGRLFFIRKFEK